MLESYLFNWCLKQSSCQHVALRHIGAQWVDVWQALVRTSSTAPDNSFSNKLYTHCSVLIGFRRGLERDLLDQIYSVLQSALTHTFRKQRCYCVGLKKRGLRCVMALFITTSLYNIYINTDFSNMPWKYLPYHF